MKSEALVGVPTIETAVKVLAVLKGLAQEPERTVKLQGESLGDLLKYLRKAEDGSLRARFFNDGGEIRPDILVFINNVDASLLGGMGAVLKDGDEVTFLPSVHGG
ncbi:MAG: MoaD/ThiS family protein [Candidatus Methanomethyliaceae archaeon]|nr:MoaD/ThiS family protein [Candidatus Methanomethyliaceae archaeon]